MHEAYAQGSIDVARLKLYGGDSDRLYALTGTHQTCMYVLISCVEFVDGLKQPKEESFFECMGEDVS